jgi:hypothetical protein
MYKVLDVVCFPSFSGRIVRPMNGQKCADLPVLFRKSSVRVVADVGVAAPLQSQLYCSTAHVLYYDRMRLSMIVLHNEYGSCTRFLSLCRHGNTTAPRGDGVKYTLEWNLNFRRCRVGNSEGPGRGEMRTSCEPAAGTEN